MYKNRTIGISGFTLIEVMIAVVVLALGLMTAVFVVSENTNTLLHLRDNTIGHWIIDAVVTDVRARLWQNVPVADSDQGTRDYWDVTWQWSYQITTPNNHGPNQGLRLLSITVQPKAGGEQVEQNIYLPAIVSGA